MKKNESGRSMVEMLGVLAIIGVLSVGGIAGYTMAMNKYRVNEAVHTIAMAGVACATGDTILTDFQTTLVTGLSCTGNEGDRTLTYTLDGDVFTAANATNVANAFNARDAQIDGVTITAGGAAPAPGAGGADPDAGGEGE